MSLPTTVGLVATGTANLASVRAALRRLGIRPDPVTTAEQVARSTHLVLPGVGHYGATLDGLRARGLDGALRDRVNAGRATLAICVGLQALAMGSDEAPDTPGLGVLPARVHRLAGPTWPQQGWNAVAGEPVYFANGFALTEAPAGWQVAWATHGTPFVAALARDRVLACQFHPELSGEVGTAWLRRWLRGQPPRLEGASGGLTRRVVPCLDVRDGRVVKGVRFQGLQDRGDPAEAAARYARQGADELVLLDVSATPEGRATAAATVAAVRNVIGIPLTVGGGVRTVADAARLLDAGADKVAVNTAALAEPALLDALADRFGRQCVVLSIDAERGPSGYRVRVRSGTRALPRDPVAWAVEGEARGAGEILLTSYDRDGTGDGYDLDLLRQLVPAVSVPVVASGGARAPSDLAAALATGASAALAASLFHDGRATVADVHAHLAARGLPVRTPPLGRTA